MRLINLFPDLAASMYYNFLTTQLYMYTQTFLMAMQLIEFRVEVDWVLRKPSRTEFDDFFFYKKEKQICTHAYMECQLIQRREFTLL